VHSMTYSVSWFCAALHLYNEQIRLRRTDTQPPSHTQPPLQPQSHVCTLPLPRPLRPWQPPPTALTDVMHAHAPPGCSARRLDGVQHASKLCKCVATPECSHPVPSVNTRMRMRMRMNANGYARPRMGCHAFGCAVTSRMHVCVLVATLRNPLTHCTPPPDDPHGDRFAGSALNLNECTATHSVTASAHGTQSICAHEVHTFA